ncbi:MAG TPA: hypothetical protein VIX73_09395 [Kofleriaceae bacterium]
MASGVNRRAQRTAAARRTQRTGTGPSWTARSTADRPDRVKPPPCTVAVEARRLQRRTGMKRNKKKLALSRETLRSLSRDDLAAANGALRDLPTRASCYTCYVTCDTVCHSIFDSCKNTDCCLEIP